MSASAPPLAAWTDLGYVLGLGALGVFAWLASEHGCRRFALACRGPTAHALGIDAARLRRVSEVTGTSTAAARSLLQQLAGEDLHATMLLLRSYRPGVSFPAVAVDGQTHLHEALAAGCGAILWVGHFVHNPLAAKVGLHRAGFAIAHLSHPRHGFSATRFGMRHLNRVRTSMEDRYLAERIRVGLDSPRAAVRTLQQRLEANGVVSMSARGDSSRPLRVPLLHGSFALAPGPAVLAVRTGAALLPAMPLRDEAGLRVHIGAPLHGDDVATLGHAYARASVPFIERYANQWLGWLHL